MDTGEHLYKELSPPLILIVSSVRSSIAHVPKILDMNGVLTLK
jgi:hypothetical protein